MEGAPALAKKALTGRGAWLAVAVMLTPVWVTIEGCSAHDSDGCGSEGQAELTVRAKDLTANLPGLHLGEYDPAGCDSGDVGEITFRYEGRTSSLLSSLTSLNCKVENATDGIVDCSSTFGVVIDFETGPADVTEGVIYTPLRLASG